MIIYGFKWFSLFVLLFLIIGSSLLFSFYGDYTVFVSSGIPWFTYGSRWSDGIITGSFAFGWACGEAPVSDGSRLLL